MSAAAIVCPGPSLDPTIIPALHEQCELVVACNRGFKAWQKYPNLKPSALYLLDSPQLFQDCIDEIVALDCPIFIEAGTRPIHVWLDRHPHLKMTGLEMASSTPNQLELDPFQGFQLRHPRKTTLVAWQHLVRQGYELIAIAGCDGRIDPKQRYFFPFRELSETQTRTQFRSYGAVIEAFRQWLPYAEARGTTTVNLSGHDSSLCNYMESIQATEITQWLSLNQ